MASFDEKLVSRIDEYIEGLFVPPDPVLAANIAAADMAGLPHINVTANQGKFLYLLAKIAGARRILEIGTLGGYSTTWLARALPAGGRVVTLEYSPVHAAVAARNLALAGLGEVVAIRVGDAAESLRTMIEAGDEPFDLVFIDADKTGYPKYLELALRLSRPGTVLIADNVIRNGDVLDENPADPNARGAREYNAAAAAHPRLESIAVPMFKEKIDGMTFSRVIA
jgi:predicted O-methyltransferase YrrM